MGAALDLVLGHLHEAVVVVGQQQLLGLPRALRVHPLADHQRPRLSVHIGMRQGFGDDLGPDAAGVGKTLASLNLAAMDVQVTAVRRKGSREVNPAAETRLQAGDVLVLLGTQGHIARAEIRVLQG